MSARTGQLRSRRYTQSARRVGTARLIISVIICVIFASGVGAETTKTGADIASGTQRFLTFYSGVFALVALTAAVAAGLLATDRIVMSPGKRIVSQAAHRAIVFVSVAFLATHILTEIIAAKSHLIDSVVPFLSPGRTFYLGLGTIGSDLIVLLAATGIARRRFAEKMSPVAWRALHGTAYLAWPMSIVHGLAAGRQPKPYVSWSYGACLFAVGLALVLRSVATVRPQHATSYARRDEASSAEERTAASAAAQAYLLHHQQAALAAGAGAGFPRAASASAMQPTTPAGEFPAAPKRYPSTPAGGLPVVRGDHAHTQDRFPGGPLPAVMRAHMAPDWARNEPPAEDARIGHDLASIPYQMQALHHAPPGEDPPTRTAAGQR